MAFKPMLRRCVLAAALLAAPLASGNTLAGDWVERPYNPPVGSRWTIQRDLFTEQNEDNAITKRTFKITSELKIVGKDATGFSVTYVRRASSYESDDKQAEHMARAALTALQNIEYHVVTDAAGKPLRVDNLNDVKSAVRGLIDGIAGASSDPTIAAVVRQTLAPMLDMDERSAAELYLDQLPVLALAQNTGLKPGETRRDSLTEKNPIGNLVVNRSLAIAHADPVSGDVTVVLTESYDPESMRALIQQLLERIGRQGADVNEPEKNLKDLRMSNDSRSEFQVVDGMTRSMTEDSTTDANLTGTRRITKSHKVVTVTPAP
jgi:hypothetical protein